MFIRILGIIGNFNLGLQILSLTLIRFSGNKNLIKLQKNRILGFLMILGIFPDPSNWTNVVSV